MLLLLFFSFPFLFPFLLFLLCLFLLFCLSREPGAQVGAELSRPRLQAPCARLCVFQASARLAVLFFLCFIQCIFLLGDRRGAGQVRAVGGHAPRRQPARVPVLPNAHEGQPQLVCSSRKKKKKKEEEEEEEKKNEGKGGRRKKERKKEKKERRNAGRWPTEKGFQ